MKRTYRRALLSIAVALCLAGGALAAAGHHGADDRDHDREVTTREISIVPFYGEGRIDLELANTHRVQGARGEARIEHQGAVSEIDLRVRDLPPAREFGGDYNTYILWAASPDGRAHNLGEVLVDRRQRARLQVTTPLDAFGVFVTAEPHYRVQSPSRFVVLESRRPDRELRGALETAQIEHREDVYAFDHETLGAVNDVDREEHRMLKQARAAMRIAEETGAESHAADEYTAAMQALERAEGAAQIDRASEEDVERFAREAVRRADEARMAAEKAEKEEAGIY